jgi:hypothetical protein
MSASDDFPIALSALAWHRQWSGMCAEIDRLRAITAPLPTMPDPDSLPQIFADGRDVVVQTIDGPIVIRSRSYNRSAYHLSAVRDGGNGWLLMPDELRAP